MKNVEILKTLNPGVVSESEKSKDVKEIYNGTRRRLIEVKLRDNEVLQKHKAAEPITVLCLAGSGIFRAGEDLNEQCELTAGILLTLEGGVPHEIEARPELDLLVTKFKDG